MNINRWFATGLVVMASVAQANDFSIVNGSTADATQYPWFVTVMVGNGQCGGSVVHPNWVLTAAHCFPGNPDPGTVVVTAGRQKLSTAGTGEERVAKRYIVHPDYNKQSQFDSDIALVELSSPLTATVVKLSPPANVVADSTPMRVVGRGGLAAPASYLKSQYQLMTSCSDDLAGCISEASKAGYSDTDIATTMLLANGLKDPTQGIGYSQLIANAPNATTVADIVAAYKAKGQTIVDVANTIVEAASGSDELRQVDLPMANFDACQGVYGSLTGNMFCAGNPSVPLDTCQGDSGGPLVVHNAKNTDWFQVGIVSFGAGCATTYGVYSKVANFLDWVSQYVPNYEADRVFMWGELKAAPGLLQASGSERSTTSFASAGYDDVRIYPASGTALAYRASDHQLIYYDGKNITPIGDFSGWLAKAKADNY